MKKIRQSNIELLRIIAMFFIIIYHFSVHSGFEVSKALTCNNVFLYSLTMYGKLGVNIFILISGYFLINQKINVKKILYIVEVVLFYSVVLYLLNRVFHYETIYYLSAIFPITSRIWWYISAYFIIYLLSPFINKVLNTLTKKEYVLLIFIILFYFCLAPLAFVQIRSFYSEIIWFVFMYIVGGYFRLYGNSNKKSFYHFIIAIFILVLQVIRLCLSIKSEKINDMDGLIYFSRTNDILIFISSIELFNGFLKLNPHYNKFVNTISSSVFSVYLIHDHPFMRELVWKNLICGVKYIDLSIFPIIAILSAIAILFGCIFISLLIKLFVLKPMNKVNDYLSKIIRSISSKVFQKFHL